MSIEVFERREIKYRLTPAQSGGAAVRVTDGSGAVLASFTPEKTYSSVVISAPGMESGGTYTVECGGEMRSVTLEGFTYSEGGFGSMSNMPGGFGGDFSGERPDGTPPSDFSGERPDGTPPAGFSGVGFGGGKPGKAA